MTSASAAAVCGLRRYKISVICLCIMCFLYGKKRLTEKMLKPMGRGRPPCPLNPPLIIIINSIVSIHSDYPTKQFGIESSKYRIKTIIRLKIRISIIIMVYTHTRTNTPSDRVQSVKTTLFKTVKNAAMDCTSLKRAS